jgi:hypothetical protein
MGMEADGAPAAEATTPQRDFTLLVSPRPLCPINGSRWKAVCTEAAAGIRRSTRSRRTPTSFRSSGNVWSRPPRAPLCCARKRGWVGGGWQDRLSQFVWDVIPPTPVTPTAPCRVDELNLAIQEKLAIPDPVRDAGLRL